MNRLFDNPTTNGPHPVADGIQRIYEFANGFTASVIQVYIMGNPVSGGADDGLWELAIMDDDVIRYDTGITDDVLGHLTEAQVEHLLHRIKNLPRD